MKYRGALKVVNTYRHFKGILFAQAQQNRRARLKHMPTNNLTKEEIEAKYVEERARSYEVANDRLKAYGPKFIAMGDSS